MLIRKLQDCPEIIAGDNTALRELLHPGRDYPFAGRYSLAHAALKPGQASLRHVLRTSEVYFILSGSGEMHIDDDSASVETGDVIHIPPGSVQWIANTGRFDLEFLCIVDPAWRQDDEEVIG